MPLRRRGDQQRALAEIVDQQRRQDEGKPHLAYRLAAEVAQVRIQRLAAGGDQEHGIQDEVAGHAVVEEEPHRVPGIDREQDFGGLEDAAEPEQREDGEPDAASTDRTRADRRRSVTLHR